MAGIWDSNLKRLVEINPQAFVTWLLGEGQVVRELSGHLNRGIDVDILYEVLFHGKRVGFHIEFQRYKDADMAGRVWEYNVFATRKYKCDVLSFVIYLKEEDNIAESPYMRTFLDVQPIHRFDFVNVKLWETPTKELMELGLTGLLPLLPLTKEGGKREVIEEVVTNLLQVEDKRIQRNLLTITFTLSSLAFDIQDDKLWLVRRFRMFQDLIRDTEIYQYIMQEGREQGREQEKKQTLQQLRQTLIAFVQARSTELVPLAQKRVEVIDSIETLNALVLNVGLAQNAEDVRHYLEEVKDK